MKLIKFTAITLFALLSFTASKAQTLDEIIAKHVEAIGGTEAWSKVKSMKMEGSMIVQGANVSVVRTVLHGKGSKQEINVAGMVGFNIVTTDSGWNFMPFNGQQQPERMTEEDIKENQEQLDAQEEFIGYKEKGSTIELVGKDDVEGTECYKLKLTFKSGKTEYLFLDPKSFLTIRQIAKQKANGQEMEVTTNFSNYQKLPEGILVAMSITLPFGEMIVSKVEVNMSVDEMIFKPAK